MCAVFYINVTSEEIKMGTPTFELSVFEPRVSRNRVLAPVAVVVEQLLLCLNVFRRHQDQMRRSIQLDKKEIHKCKQRQTLSPITDEQC